jgi:hypothetical protein
MVCMSPSKLDAQFQKVYEKALPFLGVNCKIKRKWWTLPEMYQRLGLPNFPLVALSSKISVLLDNWGFHGQAHSNCLAMAFNNFLVEVGLYSSPFDWSYKDVGHLATESTWFCDFWNLVHTFAVDVLFRTDDLAHGVRKNNQSLMSEFYRIGYRGKELLALNIVCHYCNLLHLSDISKCDGVTLDEYIVLDCLEISALHVFLRGEPTPSNHRLWREAISWLCSGTTTLPTSLGPFVRFPHIHCQWFTNEEADTLYLVGDE